MTLAAAGAALAHSQQEVTYPEDGALLSAPPEVVSMRFAAPMRMTVIRLTSETGDAYDLEHPGGLQPATHFEAIPPELPAGRYTVDWRGLSPDGHLMKGRFSFEVAE